MPFRSLPNTDSERLKALRTARKKAAREAGRSPLRPETATRLNAVAPQFERCLQERVAAEFAQVEATAGVKGEFSKLSMLVSHFFQVFQFGVARGKFSASERVLLGLGLHQEALPPLSTRADVLLWADRIIDGEAQRVVRGATAMTNPDAGEIARVLREVEPLKDQQNERKDEFAEKQEAVAQLRPEADAILRDIWDEVEFHHRLEDAPSKRRKCSEWGVVYRLRANEVEEEELDLAIGRKGEANPSPGRTPVPVDEEDILAP